MLIPAACNRWVKIIKAEGPIGIAILRNIELEQCISNDIWDIFFDELKGASFTDFQSAIRAACDILKSNPLQYYFKGNTPPINVFIDLFRIEKITSMTYRIPNFMHETGLTDLDLSTMESDQINYLLEEYSKEASLGNQLGIVWATDLKYIEPNLSDISKLINLLGIKSSTIGNKFVLFKYKRKSVPGNLHVPRVFEGLDSPEFRLQVDCSKTSGMTLPISGPEDSGLPEIVHASCNIVLKDIIAGDII